MAGRVKARDGQLGQRRVVNHERPALGNLDAYISAVNRLPMLTAEEETEFARKFRDMVPDLVWSVQPKINPDDRKRLVKTIMLSRTYQLSAVPNDINRDDETNFSHTIVRGISAEAMHEKRPTDGKANLVTNSACFGCTIACGRVQTIDKGHFTIENKPQYWGASGGLEYEAAWALGAANGVNDLEALQYANLLCNEHGMDPISFGATVGAVMELYEMGVLTKEQLGIDAKFGSAQALAHFAEITAKGEGFGKEIGMGSKRLCAKYGKPELSMSVKGQEFPAYDSRGIQGMGLAYATSNRGACHLRGYTVASEVLGIPVKTDPLATEGKPELVKAFQDATSVFDSAGVCALTYSNANPFCCTAARQMSGVCSLTYLSA